ncbi:MAG: radical SAM protein [Chloroflexi bacterium]|nr:radical SAM protein [Chloroflexota bacterium]
MYSKVLICVPHSVGFHGWPSFPHPGLGYLAEVLERNGIGVDILDMRLGHSVNDLLRRAEEFGADLVGVSTWTFRHKEAYALINRLKEAGYTVVVGGPHVSVVGRKVLEECNADYAIKHEAEFRLLRLCQTKALDQIEGLIYRRSGSIVENGNGDFVDDLDSIPFPRYRSFELNRYAPGGGVPIVSSRGCPYMCTFCSAKLVVGRRFRARSAKNVVDEVEYWYREGRRRFSFVDDNFTFDRQRVLDICDLIEQRGLTGLIGECGNGVRADKVDVPLLQRMKAVGFNSLAIGVEAGNDKVLKSIKKGESKEAIEKAIKAACDVGFSTRLYFLLGSPGETPQDLEDAVQLALKYPVQEAKFSNIIPFPGTELYNWIEQNRLFLVDPKEYLNTTMLYDDVPVFETPDFSAAERKKAYVYTRKVRITIMQRALRREVMAKYGIFGHVLFPILRMPSSEFSQYNKFLQKLRTTRLYRFLLSIRHAELKKSSGGRNGHGR